MADKEKIGFVAPHRLRPTEDGSCEYCDGTKKEHVDFFPDKNPLARIEYAKPHRFIRRAGSRGDCDYCGQPHDDHRRYFPEHNPEGDRGIELDVSTPNASFAESFQKPEAPNR